MQSKLQNLITNLSIKIKKKADYLILRNEELKVYEDTLEKKYDPVFKTVKETTHES